MRGDSINHTLFMGMSTTGKTHLASWLGEDIASAGLGKFWWVWCPTKWQLEEALTFLSKNRLTAKNYKQFKDKKPRSFDVRIYVPLSENLPDKLPNNFVPFTIPIGSIDATSFKFLYGQREIHSFYSEYDQAKRMLKPKDSFATLKKILNQSLTSGNVATVHGFMGTKTVAFKEGSYSTISSLLNKLNNINYEGIMSSDSFVLNLNRLLAEEVRHPERVVVLYLGYINNLYTQLFVASKFIMAVWEQCMAYRSSFDYKHVIYFNETRDLFPHSQSKSFSEIHIALTGLQAFLTTKSRHVNMELWYDTQSHSYVDPEARSQFRTKYVTRVSEPSEIEWLSKETLQPAEKLKAIFSLWTRQNKRRFLDTVLCSSIMPSWENHGKREYGFELPRPRLSMHGKYDLGTGVQPDLRMIGRPMVDVEHYKHMLKDEWTESEGQLQEWMKKREEKSKEEIQARMTDLAKKVLRKIRFYESEVSLVQLSRDLGIPYATLQRAQSDMLASGELVKDGDKIVPA